MRKPISPLQQQTVERLLLALSATMKERGVKTKWVAWKANVTDDALYKVLRGEKSPGLGLLTAVGDVFGMELTWKEKEK